MPLSGASLKDSGEGKSSQWAELEEVHPITDFAWKEKWLNVQFYTGLCIVASDLAGWSGTWKEHD